MKCFKLADARSSLDFFWPRFEERDGIVLLAGESTPQLHEFNTLSAAESNYNHQHVFDHFRHSIAFEEHPDGSCSWDIECEEFKLACELGKRAAEMWTAKLCRDFPRYRFRVYWTKLDNPIVRFHRVREGEPFWIDDQKAAAQIARGEIVIYDNAVSG